MVEVASPQDCHITLDGIASVSIKNLLENLGIDPSSKNKKIAGELCKPFAKGKTKVMLNGQPTFVNRFFPCDYGSMRRCIKASGLLNSQMQFIELGEVVACIEKCNNDDSYYYATFKNTHPYDYHILAMTLPTSSLGNNETTGWFISGNLEKDVFTWVFDFEAVHPLWGFKGKVAGRFEKEVRSHSREALIQFITDHVPQCWDYADT